MERNERGKSLPLMNTNRKSEMDDRVPNSGLQPPSATQDQSPAGLCLLLAVCFLSACRKEFLSKEFRSLAGEESIGTRGDFMSGRDI